MQCTKPMKVNKQIIPCNYCLACRINRSTIWSFRILAELPEFEGNAIFTTLTYNDDNLPLANDDKIIKMTLKKKEIQDFHKRVRKELRRPIKYYVAGEYGGEYGRPHYHGIYLGMTKKDSELIYEKWHKGNIDIGNVTTASIRYVTDYIMEKTAEDEYLPAEPPFALISNGIGKKYFTWNMTLDDIQKAFNDGYITDQYGKKIKLPKYLKDKYEELTPCQPEILYRHKLWKRVGEGKSIKALTDVMQADVLRQDQIEKKLELKQSRRKRQDL